MAIKTRSKISSETSMSSMSDLVFLLLIFFMITSSMIAQNALNLFLTWSNSQTIAKPFTTVSIEDMNDGTYTFAVGMQICAETDVEQLLKKELIGQEDPYVSLHVDKSVPMEQVVKVMNIAKNNNWKLILATQPE